MSGLDLSAQHWRSLVERSVDSIMLCDAQGTVIYANPAALRLAQTIGLDGLCGRPASALRCGADEDEGWTQLRLLMATGGRMPYVSCSLGGSAAPMTVQISAVAYDSEAGLCTQIMIHDLTTLRQQQTAAQDQLRFVEQLIDAIPLPLSLRDPEGRFVRVNRAFERAHGCERSAVLGRSMFDLLPRSLATAIAREDLLAQHVDRPVDYQLQLPGPNGATTDTLIRALAMRREDASPAGIVTLETDISALRRKEEELTALNAELSGMSARLIDAQEKERRRIARELHDEVGQILTALKIQLGTLALRKRIDEAALQPVRELADEALRHARDLTASLHPHLLDDLGLEPALRWLIERFSRPTGLQADLHCRLRPERASSQLELVAFRVIQESLTNIVRHAGASHASVRLRASDGTLLVEIRDNGSGFDATGSAPGPGDEMSVGVMGMRERVAEVGGEFSIDTAPGAGTSVRVILPW
jgi:PAS domain S-box-containing protein